MIKRYKPAEAWATDGEAVLLVRNNGGGYTAFLRADVYANGLGVTLENQPGIAPTVIDARTQLLNAKKVQ